MSQEWIIQQGRDWLVVNKPAGLSVHNQPGADLISLVSKLQGGRYPYAPVFRLDQETSGLILLSCNPDITRQWHLALEDDSSQKIYTCLLRGTLRKTGEPATAETGLWNWPLTDKAEGRTNPQGKSSERKACETKFQVLQQNPYFTLVQCELLTGRQHQIRKHAALSRHAIVGDSRYGDKAYNQMIADRYQTSRLFLHAGELICKFEGRLWTWKAELPAEFNRVLTGSKPA